MQIMTEKRTRGRPRLAAVPDAGAVQSLDRAITLLRLVSDGSGLSLTEISRLSTLPPSTAYRMLTTLQHHGMLEFDEPTQLWFVGVETFRMGSAFLRRRKLVDRGRSILQNLMVATGETANLALGEADGVVFVSQVETHEAIRAFFRPGTRSPYHCSGIGKALLASRSPQVRQAILGGLTFEAFTPKTLTTPGALEADLAGTATRGFAIDDEERNVGMRCVAAAIFDEFGEPVAGISISGPTVRMTDARLAALGASVREAASRITLAIGGSAPPAAG
ncbi:MAG: IclR family transcriptional regulator [Beijerinckiaceae bacterium]|jgi:IclR family acetate operon transcriptional repressor|nr:IclR family transcriptional regulator [Beijerinckiaceae bacterium]